MGLPEKYNRATLIELNQIGWMPGYLIEKASRVQIDCYLTAFQCSSGDGCSLIFPRVKSRTTISDI